MKVKRVGDRERKGNQLDKWEGGITLIHRLPFFKEKENRRDIWRSWRALWLLLIRDAYLIQIQGGPDLYVHQMKITRCISSSFQQWWNVIHYIKSSTLPKCIMHIIYMYIHTHTYKHSTKWVTLQILIDTKYKNQLITEKVLLCVPTVYKVFQISTTFKTFTIQFL